MSAAQPGLLPYLLVAAALFSLGLGTVVSRRNAIAVLMGVELMLNGANLNLVAFNRFCAPAVLGGQLFSLFVIVLAAAEAAVALSIVLSLYRALRTVDLERARSLRG